MDIEGRSFTGLPVRSQKGDVSLLSDVVWEVLS